MPVIVNAELIEGLRGSWNSISYLGGRKNALSCLDRIRHGCIFRFAKSVKPEASGLRIFLSCNKYITKPLHFQ
jgi:hypothetical protein